MVMPGRERTSSSACLERLPEPLGRPRLPVPVPRDAAALRGRRAVAETAERQVGRHELVVLVDEWFEFLQARLDLFALLVEKVGHVSVTPGQ